MKHIFDPVEMNNMALKNRLVRSATWEGIANPDGSVTEEAYRIYEELAKGGVGAAITGFTSVALHDHYFDGMMRLSAVNHREDAWGGSADRRSRILLEILEGIRRQTPDLHVTIKINCSDFTAGGLTDEACLCICRLLDEAGIDSIEISGNGTSVPGIRARVNEGYFVPAAAEIANEVSCPIMVVGGFRSVDVMEDVLNRTKIELISLSRPLLCEPDLPDKMKADPSVISKCISFNACYSSQEHRCIFRKRDTL